MQMSLNTSAPYDQRAGIKTPLFLEEMNTLSHWHYDQCGPYRNIIDAVYNGQRRATQLSEVPFIPVRIFKNLELVSVPRDRIVKTLTSSGTSGQAPSRIMLDKDTAMQQTRALAAIVQSFLGPKRLPMAVVDSSGVLKNRDAFSARGAGILGFSSFGRNPICLLKDSMDLDIDLVTHFTSKHRDSPVFLFGFTFIVWKHLYQASLKTGHKIDFGDSVLIHGGGWKKLAADSVSNRDFKQAMRDQLGIRRVYDYYGMVEQTGSIFMECEAGFFHASRFSNVLIRDPETLEPLPVGTPGLIQTMSNIPHSYPGHALLTDDLGTLIGEDSCACGRAGKFFLVEGRLPRAELRGCSDTYQELS